MSPPPWRSWWPTWALPAPLVDQLLQAADLKALQWRSIGPANMSGRLAAIALAPGNAKTCYLGYATGGLWKTTNNGTTFTGVFDEEATSSIGSIVVCDAPPDWPGWGDDEDVEKGKAKIVWVGTGEGNNRNSSSWGHGVYRSTDAGGTFEHLGLSDSHDIPALAVHPHNPDVCFVAALGHLWGPNHERGVDFDTLSASQSTVASLQTENRKTLP